MYSQKITAEQMQKNNLVEYYTIWCHQIKTPIAAMSLLLQEEDTPKNRQLKSELFRIEQYVEMVLCYFRIDSPSSDFILKPYDLDTVIRKAIRKYAGQFVQKKLRLIYEPVHQSVLTDEKWLSFILEQLLSNAVKYTKEGSVTITVDQNQVLSVSDTGIGIAKEDLPRISKTVLPDITAGQTGNPPVSDCICVSRLPGNCHIHCPWNLKSDAALLSIWT